MTTRHLPPPSLTSRGAAPPLLITVTDVPGAARVLRLDGEIDHDALAAAVEARPPRLVHHLRQHPHRRLRPADGPPPRAGRRAAMSSELKTSTRRIGPAVVCVLAGDLHQGTADQAQHALDTALAELPEVLAVDLSGVELLASGGLNTLLRARTAAADRTVPTVLVAPSTGARRVLEITDTAGLFPVYATAEAAARHREKPPASDR